VKLLLAVGLTAATATAARAHEGWGIVRDATGRLYVADVPANTIWRIDPDGRRVAAVRGVHSHALVIGPDGAVYGTDVALDGFARVWRLDGRGVVTTETDSTVGSRQSTAWRGSPTARSRSPT
jgi:streptogramin lyase